MKTVLIKDIFIGERQRELDLDNIQQLKDSILSKGLLHPIVVIETSDPTILEPYALVAGRHRLESIQQLHAEEKAFLCDALAVPINEVPAIDVTQLSPADLLEAELEENIVRAQISWQDRAKALTTIAELRQKENPKTTNLSISKELQKKGDKRSTDHIAKEIRNAQILAKHLHKPSIQKARNSTEALGIILKEEEARLEAELIRRRKRAAESGKDTSLVTVELGDFTEILPTYDDNMFDLIIADLPYGISADSAGFRKRTVEHHNYSDTPEEASTLLKAILIEGFRVAKLRSNIFIFGDIDLFPFFKQQASAMGWKPFRTPIIWQKSESEGLAPWGREGPRRTYELIFFATKGKKGLLQSPTDILTCKRVSRAKRRYGPEKPVELLRTLVECASMPGDLVLDPCCGSGSTLAACRQLNRQAIGIEIDEAAYNLAVVAADRDLEEYDETENIEIPAGSSGAGTEQLPKDANK